MNKIRGVFKKGLCALSILAMMTSGVGAAGPDIINETDLSSYQCELDPDEPTTPEIAYTMLALHYGIDLNKVSATQIAKINHWDIYRETINREYAIYVILRGLGITAANEDDYVWADEQEQFEEYRPYIDMALRHGITSGIGDNVYGPKEIIPVGQFIALLNNAIEVQDELEIGFPIRCESTLAKLTSSNVMEGIMMVPEHVRDSFLANGWTYTIIDFPFHRGINGMRRDQLAGLTMYGEHTIEQVSWLDNYKGYYQLITAIHEFGHYVHEAAVMRIPSSVIEEESAWLISQCGRYCMTNQNEFFAEAFVEYITNMEEFKSNCPRSSEYIEKALNRI